MTKYIEIPPLQLQEMQLPQFFVSREVLRENNSFRYNKGALEYQRYNPPSLANLVQAFFGRTSDGEYISQEFRSSVISTEEEGEWTCSFVQQREKGYPFLILMNRPEFYFENSQLHARCDPADSYPVISPSSGWVTEFDMETGWPKNTSKEVNDAKVEFGSSLAYLDISDGINGISPICRYHPRTGRTPFLIYVRGNILTFDAYVGAREFRTQMPDQRCIIKDS